MAKAGYRCADHNYKGFLIGYSDYMEGWTLEPTFLYLMYPEINKCTLADLANELRDNSPEFNTLKEAKEYIREYESVLRNEVIQLVEAYKSK